MIKDMTILLNSGKPCRPNRALHSAAAQGNLQSPWIKTQKHIAGTWPYACSTDCLFSVPGCPAAEPPDAPRDPAAASDAAPGRRRAPAPTQPPGPQPAAPDPSSTTPSPWARWWGTHWCPLPPKHTPSVSPTQRWLQLHNGHKATTTQCALHVIGPAETTSI